MGKSKKYRGQRVQKSYRYGCGCFYCTGTDKEDRRIITEKLIDKEAAEEVNNFILPDVIGCDHEIEYMKEINGEMVLVCGYCDEPKKDYL